MFKITVVKCRNLVESRLGGTFTPRLIDEYEAALRSHFAKGTLFPGYWMLINVSQATIQPQPVIEAFIRHVARMPKASRIAVLTGTSVIRMQVRRVLQQPYVQLFEDRTEALAWLLGSEEHELAA